MRTTAFLIVGMIVLAIFVGAKMTTTHKETVAGLVMPGKLTNAHAKFENQCAKCHSDFKKEDQRELCFSCHENIRTDINTIKGYHGRLENIVERLRHCSPRQRNIQTRPYGFSTQGRTRTVKCSL